MALDEKGASSGARERRVAGNFELKQAAKSQYIDVSPKQLVSVAAS
jgi:DNA-directed RNA polymerase beta subunit